MAELNRWGVVAIVRLDHAPADELVESLLAGGVTNVEVTLPTPGCLEVVRRWRGRGDCRVGVGTVRTVEDAARAIGAGAEFLVTPTTQPAVLQVAAQSEVPVLCGAMTPTEIDTAWQLGASAVKVFPAAALGGPDYVRALRDPLPDIPLLPTGGVDVSASAAYAELGCAGVGVGGALVRPAAVTRAEWAAVRGAALAFTAPWAGASRAGAQR